MEANQRINCTVGSCKYNDHSEQECKLDSIIVTPKQNCDPHRAKESLCRSYKNQEE